jgi:hypothetical protein
MTVSRCVPNIGPKQRRKRLRFGIGAACAAAALLALLVAGDFSRWWRLTLFLPLWMSATGLSQAYRKTCVALAAKNQRNMDSGEEAIAGDELARVKVQARQVLLESLLIACVLTAGTLFIRA